MTDEPRGPRAAHEGRGPLAVAGAPTEPLSAPADPAGRGSWRSNGGLHSASARLAARFDSMARLHENQGKHLLAQAGVAVPRGGVASTAAEAGALATRLGCPTVVKIQAWTTGRAALGGIVKAADADAAFKAAERLIGMRVGSFVVDRVLVEEQLPIGHELFVSLAIDDRGRSPVLLLSAVGGTGIEDRGDRMHRIPCSVDGTADTASLSRAVATFGFPAEIGARVVEAATRVVRLARSIDARSLEINPLAVLTDGRVVALDCRVTIDDYAVPRHPELGIDIAREFDHPPTELERIAYAVEMADHRGTFFFAQLPADTANEARPRAGFHGSGGGGAMMAMDALVNEGFAPANFTDTSGNPSAAKVYRAARIILSQPGLVGYFGSGSGVASQEQWWSAYGLAKAFLELELDVPVVMRLGGNGEDRAVDVLRSACARLPAPIEGYRKSDTPAFIARRFRQLVDASGVVWRPRARKVPPFVRAPHAITFPIRGGRLVLDAQAWPQVGRVVSALSEGLIRDDGGRPALSEEASGKDSELIACEIECRRGGLDAVFVDLPVPGLDPEGAVAAPGAGPARIGGTSAWQS